MNYISYARSKIGQKEIPGKGNNPYIQSCLYQVGMKTSQDDKDAWCGAFMYDVMLRSNNPNMPRFPASARAWLNYGTELSEPEFGCLVIYSRPVIGLDGKLILDDGKHGHVHLYMFGLDGEICGLGGNQRNSVCLDFYKVKRVLGYRKP